MVYAPNFISEDEDNPAFGEIRLSTQRDLYYSDFTVSNPTLSSIDTESHSWEVEQTIDPALLTYCSGLTDSSVYDTSMQQP